MKLSEEQKSHIVDEFTYVIEKMENSKTLDESLYFFTGIHSALNRILNMNYSSELLFTDMIVHNCHDICNARMQALKAGQTVIPFADNLGQRLIELTRKLSDVFFVKTKRMKILEEMIATVYATTGNGFYLNGKIAQTK